jgi:outer membrane protein assembly factor BamA
MRRFVIIICVACCFVTVTSAQSEECLPNSIQSTQSNQSAANSRQTKAERFQLIDEAERNQYWVRRVEFVGNEHIRDSTLRRRFLQQEGDVFTRRDLAKGLKSLSRVKLIYPVTLYDVDVRLTREDRLIDLVIFFRERPYARRGSKIY